MTDVNGFVAPGFEGVREVFAANFERHGDIGAGVAVFHGGECVVDLTGGVTEPDGTETYSPHHLQLMYSSTKGATALCAHLLVDRGLLDLDAPVASYWPEFAAKGKDRVPVSWLLSHRAGLPDVDREMSYEEALAWDPVVDALAASAPMWEPGTKHGYHAVTFGWLVGELVRRVSGRSLGTFFAEEVAGPLGLDLWIGLPDDHHHRVVPIIPMSLPPGIELPEGSPGMIELLRMLMGADSLIARALSAPGGAFGGEDIWNDPVLWRAELGAANGIGNARSLAKMYAAMVGPVEGVRLLSDETLARAAEPQVSGPDAVLSFDLPFTLGFMRDSPFSKMGSPTAFGHYGAGGSAGFADPARDLSFAYVMNKMAIGIAGDPRTSDLIDALNAAVR
ncbi:MAG: beta-lactamase family protein [Microthrixaceae bacterium]|nr:beta-lactamase family protein [Microthrixaceae bacterium]